ncbi:hypothetical protein K1719_023268 [Acacia pycnantha]|nr:hypothetical protein K1719_023268 [Acacia pycnantha]
MSGILQIPLIATTRENIMTKEEELVEEEEHMEEEEYRNCREKCDECPRERARKREGEWRQGGVGEGDGGKTSTLGGNGKGFSFGRVAESKTSGVGVKKGSSLSQQGGSSSLSYRDKLLSPGCGGFLVNHSEEDDIVKGWRDYFHKMNGKEPYRDLEESDEENNPMEAMLEGKPGRLSFSAEEYTTWCLPWMNSLIIKVMGASFPTYVIRDRINRMWHPKETLKLVPLSNGYFIVSFFNKEDREYAF